MTMIAFRRTRSVTTIARLATLGAIAVALFLGRVVPAGAAGATITATPNPVLIPQGQTTAKTTVAWDTAGAGAPSISISKNGGAPHADAGLNAQVKGPKGSAQLTVDVDSTYILRLFGERAPQPLASVTFTTQHPGSGGTDNLVGVDPGVIANAACAVGQCITDVSVMPHGTYAHVQVKTSQPAWFDVEVSTEAPDAQHKFKHADASAGEYGTQKTTFSGDVWPLKPGTKYHYVVSVAGGGLVYKEGTFVTKSPVVSVVFHTVELNNDSDDLDGYFVFTAGGSEFKTTEREIDPGEKWLLVSFCTEITSSSGWGCNVDGISYGMLGLTGQISVFGRDDDTTIFDAVPVHHDASITKNYTMDIVNGPGEEYSKPLDLPAFGPTLKFTVHATLYLRYVS